MSGLVSVGYFLISTFFGLLTLVLWLRFGLRYFRISQLHPVRQIVQRLTDPVFTPIHKTLQIHLTPFQRYDWVCIGLLFVIEWIKFIAISILYFGHTRVWLLTAVYAFADFIIQPCDLLFYAVLIRAIMSWVNPLWQHPLATILYAVTEPMLQHIRRHLPNMAGLDFSPLVMMVLLKIITLFVGASLPFH